MISAFNVFDLRDDFESIEIKIQNIHLKRIHTESYVSFLLFLLQYQSLPLTVWSGKRCSSLATFVLLKTTKSEWCFGTRKAGVSRFTGKIIPIKRRLSVFQKRRNFEFFQLASVCTVKYKFPLRERVNIFLLRYKRTEKTPFRTQKSSICIRARFRERNQKGMSRTAQVRKFPALFSTVKFIRSGRRFASATREILHIEWRPARRRQRRVAERREAREKEAVGKAIRRVIFKKCNKV